MFFVPFFGGKRSKYPLMCEIDDGIPTLMLSSLVDPLGIPQITQQITILEGFVIINCHFRCLLPSFIKCADWRFSPISNFFQSD
jgi:hypothetical protein